MPSNIPNSFCVFNTAENSYRFLNLLFCIVKSCFYEVLCPTTRPANQRLNFFVLVLFKNSRFEASRSLKIAENALSILGLYENKVMRRIVAHARRCAQTDGSALKRTLLFRHFSSSCVCGCAKTLFPTQKWCERRLEGRGVQDRVNEVKI